MGKNKFFKKLIVAGLCAVTATATFGVTACGGDNNDGGSDKHTCNFAMAWSSDKDGHWHACLNAGHTEAYVKTKHTDEDKNSECDACGWALEIKYATEKFRININGSTAVADKTEIAADTGVFATGGLSVSDSGKSSIYGGTAVSFTHCIKMGGIAKQDAETKAVTGALKFDIEKDNSVIVAYVCGGSSNTLRSAVLKDKDFKDVERQSVGNGNHITTLVFEVEKAGTYYFGGASAGDGEKSGSISIYHIAVWEGGILKETVIETKNAAEATCTTVGNIAYTKTDFGRYRDGKGNTVTEYQLTSAATGHEWKLEDKANWVLPKAENGTFTEGSLKLLCENDHAHDRSVVLPALNSGKYEILTKDDLPDLEDGQAIYAYAIPDTENKDGEAVTAQFTAVEVEQIKYRYETKYSNILNGTVGIGKENKTALANGIKIYGMTNNTTEVTAWDGKYSVTAAGNTLTVTDKGYDSETESGKSALAFLVFDEGLTSGVYKVEGSISLSNYGNGTTSDSATGNWSPLQLISNDSTDKADTFATLRTSKDKKLGVANTTDGDAVQGNGFAYAAGTEYSFEFMVDLGSKEVTLTLKNGTKEEYKQTVFITAESWKGLKIQTADKADRTVVLKNLVISQRVVDEG